MRKSTIIPSKITRRKSYLAQDNERLGTNLRRWIIRRATRWGFTYREVAQMSGLQPSSLSRILRGFGTSERTLLKIAEVLNIPAGRFLVGLEHPERFPNILPYRDRSSRTKQAGYCIPVRSIDTLLQSDTHLSAFVGGIPDEESLKRVRVALWKVKEFARKKREQHLESTAERHDLMDYLR